MIKGQFYIQAIKGFLMGINKQFLTLKFIQNLEDNLPTSKRKSFKMLLAEKNTVPSFILEEKVKWATETETQIPEQDIKALQGELIRSFYNDSPMLDDPPFPEFRKPTFKMMSAKRA